MVTKEQDMKRLLASVILCVSICLLHAQKFESPQSEWKEVSKRSLKAKKISEHRKFPSDYRVFEIDFQQLSAKLADGVRLSLPFPDGGIEEFMFREISILSEDLEFKYPTIKAFTGVSKSDPGITARISITAHGLHGMMFYDDDIFFIDPYSESDLDKYLVYRRSDYKSATDFQCMHDEVAQKKSKQTHERASAGNDCVLRVYRLAVASTAEYTGFWHTQLGTQAEVIALINRVNGVFERDFGVRFIIVTDTSTFYTSTNLDPYTNGNSTAMIGENQTNLDAVVGDANYDIGHVFGTSGGGLATLPSACVTGSKGRGVSAKNFPVGDPFIIDMVCHEFGHQFGAYHSFSSSSGFCGTYGTAASAYEPGSGSTIMSYSGLCSPNIQGLSDAYFHANSISEVKANITTGASSVCPTEITLGNHSPEADAGSDYYIPISTPFMLDGQSFDVDGDDVTHNWEQMDLGVRRSSPALAATDGPNFRSYEPNASTVRIFPKTSDLVAGTQWPTWEVIPNVSRTMTFRFTARDNHISGYGCTCYDDMELTTVASAGPFVVTQPNTSGVSWVGGSTQTITWDVANTQLAPISCSSVDISLSIDGGYSFPYSLVSGVANDGSQQITVPNINASEVRVRVKGADNIFFDISNNDLSITQSASARPLISFVTSSLQVMESDVPSGNNSCLSYTDHQIGVAISSPPISTVSVDVSVASDAISGVDYELIGVPVIFPAGSSALQNFVLRVWDDDVVENSEVLNLNISTSSGAAEIDFTKQFDTITIVSDDVVPLSSSTFSTIYFEDFESTADGDLPTDWVEYNLLSSADDFVVGSSGAMSGNKSLYVQNNGVFGYTTSDDLFSQTRIIDGQGYTNLQLTFDYKCLGESGLDYAELYYDIEGDQYFNVIIDTYQGQSASQKVTIDLSALGLNNHLFRLGWRFQSNGAVFNQPSLTIDNIKVTAGLPGSPLATTQTTTPDERHVGPNETVYFYDPADQSLLAGITNNSNFDFGCTTLAIDRVGAGAVDFQTASNSFGVTSQSLRVIPENDQAIAPFSITAFFSEAQLAGWEGVTGKSRNDLKMAKTEGMSVSQVTPSQPRPSTTSYGSGTVLGDFGADFGLTATFNGFLGSGFAGGVQTTVPLPVDLLDLKAVKVENRVMLKWKVVGEKAVDGYEIWRTSSVVKVGARIGFVSSLNMSYVFEYQFEDFNAPRGELYYRVVARDLDGSVSFDEVVAVLNDNPTIVCFPNPAKDQMNITAGSSGIRRIRLLDTAGRDVYSNRIDSNQEFVVLPVQSLESGSYLLIVDLENYEVVRELIQVVH